jgi:hypothetical protein
LGPNWVIPTAIYGVFWPITRHMWGSLPANCVSPTELTLRDIRDPRRRQGRIYPLASILTMLTLAAVNGESTLRGMWKWAEQHWERIRDRLSGQKVLRGMGRYGT